MSEATEIVVDVDWEDPCERAKALRDAYYNRLQGGTMQRVRFKHGDNEQEVQSGMMMGSLDALRRAMQDAEDECLISKGQNPRNRRFAITAGSRRR